ncbi:MAG: hypothetical protein NC110_02130, partial [Ruminococcus sp.]|nr:hypothetical protein [Ruminococcus sp.]
SKRKRFDSSLTEGAKKAFLKTFTGDRWSPLHSFYLLFFTFIFFTFIFFYLLRFCNILMRFHGFMLYFQLILLQNRAFLSHFCRFLLQNQILRQQSCGWQHPTRNTKKDKKGSLATAF